RFSRGGTYRHTARRSPTRPQDEQRRAAEHLIVDMPGMPSILLLLAGRAAARHLHMDMRWLTGANAAPVPAAETKRPRSAGTRAANPYRCRPVVPSVVISVEFSVGIVHNLMRQSKQAVRSRLRTARTRSRTRRAPSGYRPHPRSCPETDLRRSDAASQAPGTALAPARDGAPARRPGSTASPGEDIRASQNAPARSDYLPSQPAHRRCRYRDRKQLRTLVRSTRV